MQLKITAITIVFYLVAFSKAAPTPQAPAGGGGLPLPMLPIIGPLLSPPPPPTPPTND
jgi:hypothetical protein